ncbi:MAG: hypothetical protein E5X53_20900 [Mesorhizobium sp.]|uniref:DUF7683 domain-containing protein n=1 Tax=Mesorhizobium sp. TaxID=1871066 RepID=UPI000FE92EFE|nr:hypothetical protein [Mesorhizobium sp.]RWM16675.1 MAG: hypothetical protein EOR73_21940 [Mesorhizobium sp.]TIP72155.1 MAG: hypothetical protein E5X55_19280 [Mesorhizobium sp.]TIQ08994.1 MAG: hypothetical protein E5X57_20765 [Mesorhizobium sp.]TIR50186.1 MAG: hypothetical protein E5X53_20900 [Mesorhizobium sp.]TJV96474.1 MAG: hypothetical protein E5X52_18805 [Mesorhizobium sp.]
MWVIWSGVTVAWELEWFDKKGERLSGSILLKNFGEEDMRPVLVVDDQSLCGGYYPIDEARAARLLELTDIAIDLGKYDYFLGAADTGLTEADRSIDPSDFPEQEVWYPTPRALPGGV